jgi:hypothetical protein
MRLRFPIPVVAVITSVVGLGAIAVAGAQDSPRLQPAANPESTFNVALNGINEIPDADLDGTGQATITVNTTTGLVCVNITTADITGIINMHIHEGDATVGSGPVRVDFAETAGTNTAVAKCVTTTTVQAAAIVATPAGFYLNAHTAAFPAGAIRGQLAPATTAGGLHLLSEPLRAYDSRAATDGKLVAGTARTVDLSSGFNGQSASVAAVPAAARAAIVTVTVTQTVGSGFLTAYSNSLTVAPSTSTINWTAPSSDIATTTTVAVDGSGKIALLAGQNGTHVIVDVIGYYV